MDLHQFLGALAIVLCGGFLQGTVAFGFGLLVVPLLLMIGLPVPVTLAVSAVCTAVQSASGVHHLRHAVPWGLVGWSLLIRAFGMAVGIWVLYQLVQDSVAAVKFWIGVVILVMTTVQVTWRPRPRSHLHKGWNWTAFILSGFTGGLSSMGGPPLVLWVMAHDWTADRTRAFLFASFMSMVPFQLAMLYVTFGRPTLDGIVAGFLLCPAVLLGSLIGLRVGSRFSKPLLSKLAFIVLVLIALNAMMPQLWKAIRH